MELLKFKNKRGKTVEMTELGLSRLSYSVKKDLKRVKTTEIPNVLKERESVLKKLGREELDEIAVGLKIDPSKFSSKPLLITEIISKENDS